MSTRILQKNIEQRLDEYLDVIHFGFRKNRGTVEAILTFRVLREKRERKGQVAFIIYSENAFNTIAGNRMLTILKKIEMYPVSFMTVNRVERDFRALRKTLSLKKLDL